MHQYSIEGTWRPVSVHVRPAAGGERRHLMGEKPTGFLIYTPDGHMSATLAAGGRSPLSVPDPGTAPADERADAFASFIGYAGRYSLAPDRVIHHVEVSWFQNWTGTDQVRFAELQDDRLTLRAPTITAGGHEMIAELVWQR